MRCSSIHPDSTCDLSWPLQQVIDREGWKPGNAIAFLFKKKMVFFFGVVLLLSGLAWPISFEQTTGATFTIDLGNYKKVYLGEPGDYFKPQAILDRWDGECWMRVEYRTKLERHAQLETYRGKIQKLYWSNPEDIEIQMFPLSGENYDGGGFEYLIVLKRKPNTNVISLDIATKGLRFCYQDSLTEEEIAEGCHRPDSVVGSYAVYHDSKQPMHRSNSGDAEKYGVGKAFHIYRPKAHDADGKWTWCGLHIQAGKMLVTVPPEWLDGAVYPVEVDPTFGYTTGGGSEIGKIDQLYTYPFDCSESGTADSLTCYVSVSDVADPAWCLIMYDASNRIDYSPEQTAQGDGLSHPFWLSMEAVVGGSVSSGEFCLGWHADGAPFGAIAMAYDTDAADSNEYESPVAYSYPPAATWTPSTSSQSRKFSIYCTYSGAPPEAGQVIIIGEKSNLHRPPTCQTEWRD